MALLLDSNEFFQRRAGGTNNGFLEAVYQVLLNRSIDGVGQRLWSARIAAGSPRGAIADEVLTSPESNRLRVEAAFREFLRRRADTNGLNAFVAVLQGGATSDAVTLGLLASEEYYIRS